ncbi:MAG: TIGR02530 family flagellar biosynthesis protein [Acidaminobacteraceae bacterium]
MSNINNDYMLRRSQVIDVNKKLTDNNKVAGRNTNINKTQSFQDVLNKIESGGKIKFSKHAASRLEKRNISLSANDIQKLEGAVEKAEKKGIKDALIVMDQNIFIASVKNKTIVTASTEADMEEKVFTNIDGAVIV